jgi:hypothetical protein
LPIVDDEGKPLLFSDSDLVSRASKVYLDLRVSAGLTVGSSTKSKKDDFQELVSAMRAPALGNKTVA